MDAALFAERIKTGDVPALSRLITLLENDNPDGGAVLKRLGEAGHRAAVIGITGYPGAGKSTLIERLVAAYRHQGKKVAVVAMDATSPVTGGAILGDRIRMQDHSLDAGVFIRSMATRGERGGLAKATGRVVQALEAAGFDIILVETVGVGQLDTDITRITPTVVHVVAPGLGDEIQAMKAGLLEVAHIVVVNKGDREGAEATVRDLQEWVPRVIRTSALKNEGLPELVQAIAEQQGSDLQRKSS